MQDNEEATRRKERDAGQRNKSYSIKIS